MSENRKTVGMVPNPSQDAAGNTHVRMTHKAVSVRQPWASMIGLLVPGFEKIIETRTWPTGHRGDLVIVSTKQPSRPSLHWPPGEYPTGVALAIVNLVDCRLMTAGDAEQARCDYIEGLFAWVLEDIRRIVPPQKVHGRLGIYTIDLDTLSGTRSPELASGEDTDL